jgi:tRNA/rRNA methyltransferase
MSNFGFSCLRLVRPYDIAFREARSAVNSRYILEDAQVFDTVEEAIADCNLVVGTTAADGRDLHVPLYPLQTASQLLRTHPSSAPAALLFGSEKFGLSNDDLSYCHWLTRIPTRHEHGSMNLGQAAAICLYELRRDNGQVNPNFPPVPRATEADYDRVGHLLFEVVRSSGYVNERTSESSRQKLRRLVRRLRIPQADVETWLGVLRQILWKVTKTGN